MKKLLLFLTLVFLYSSSSTAAPDLNAAVKDFCKCLPPSPPGCFDALEKKYPEIAQNKDLQDRVMSRANEECRKTPDIMSGMGLSVGTDCSTNKFTVLPAKNWQCRKQKINAQDITLFNKGNRLNVTVGLNQGMTSCSVIPICTNKAYKLSNKFSTRQYTNPMAGTYEYAGTYINNKKFKLTITSNTKPTQEDFKQIEIILDSFTEK